MPIKYDTQYESQEYMTVNSCGERYLGDKKYDVLRENGRIDYGLQFIESGKCYFEDNGVVRIAEAGIVLLHFPKVRQNYYFYHEDNAHIMWVHFSGTACSMLDTLKSSETVHIKLNDSARFKRILEQMVSEFYDKKSQYKVFCEGGIVILMSLMLRNEDKQSVALSKQRHQQLSEVISYMNMSYERPLDIERYAKMCYVSHDWFIHKFKSYTGMSPSQYLTQIRMEKAKEMLEYSKHRVSEIAERCGYNNSAYFCKVFKSYTGQSPKSFRNK